MYESQRLLANQHSLRSGPKHLQLQPPLLTPWRSRQRGICLESLKWQNPQYMASEALEYYVVPSSRNELFGMSNFRSKFLITFMYTVVEYKPVFTVLAFYKVKVINYKRCSESNIREPKVTEKA